MKRMMVLGGAVGCLLGLGVAVFVVGLRLPAEHVATRTRQIEAPVNQVADRVRRVEAQTQWRRSVSGIEVRSRVTRTTRYTEHAGNEAVAFELIEAADGRQFESRITSTDLPYGGRWLISLEPLNHTRTRIEIQEQGVVHSPFFRALGRYVFGYTATMDAYLDDLEQSFSERGNGA